MVIFHSYVKLPEGTGHSLGALLIAHVDGAGFDLPWSSLSLM
jgi:hypothetical protein